MTHLTTKEETRFAVKFFIDLYHRNVRFIDAELNLVVCVDSDWSCKQFEIQIYYTSRLAPVSHDPKLQDEDQRDFLTVLIPVGAPLAELEEKTTEILDQLSLINLAA